MLTSLILLSVLLSCDAARILVMLPSPVRSHYVMVESYMKVLAARGHQLTIVTRHKQNEHITNSTEILITEDINLFINDKGLSFEYLKNYNRIVNIIGLGKLGVETCKATLKDKAFRQMVADPNVHFDVVINEIFNTDCFLPLAHHYGALSILVNTCVMFPWGNDRIANPDNPSYIQNLFYGYTAPMTFSERLINTLALLFHKVMYHFLYDTPSETLARESFGDSFPPLQQLAKNTSLVLVNSHFSLSGARPFVPGAIEIGGIHITKPKPLPKHLADFLNGAEHGVIYFSMGSVLRSETLPPEKRDAFLQAFAELPHKILWKWEADVLPGQPDNVKTEKWAPQLDVLCHPKVKAFISHGGLMGTLEAVYAGVPVIGIPMFGDQYANVNNLVAHGTGFYLDYHNITKESVLEALKLLLYDPSYKRNAEQLSQLFVDRPQSALDSAVYWTEYVIRHKGAPHMRSAAVNLTWYQYLLLDVLAFIFFVVFILLGILYFMIRKCTRKLFSSNQQHTVSKKKKKH